MSVSSPDDDSGGHPDHPGGAVKEASRWSSNTGRSTVKHVLEIRLVGVIEASHDGRALHLPTGRPLEVFAWLACHPGRHARSRLAPLFWGDVSDATSRASLRTALWALRRSLGDGADVLHTDRDEIGLDDAAVWVDLREFASLSDPGDVGRALELSNGEILPGVVADWVDEIREDHRRRLTMLLKAAADRAEADRDLPTALERNRQRSRLDPFDEEAHRDLLRLLAMTGQTAAGAREHATFRRRLWQELRVVPSTQTTQLASQLASTSVSRAVDQLPSRLEEAETHPFVGRLEALDLLERTWQRAQDRARRQVIVVAGEAGIGKTRLAARFGSIVSNLGGSVLYGAAIDDGLVAGGAYVEALDLDAVDAPGQVLRAATARLSAVSKGSPVLLILDDLHWADMLTLALLRRAARGECAGAVMTMITYRQTEDGDAKVASLVADLERDCDVTRVWLAGLSESESTQLLGMLSYPPEGASRVHRRTGGNPFFMREIVRFLAESDGMTTMGEGEIPWSIRDLVTSRLHRLSKDAADFLAVAAVVGNEAALVMVREGLDTGDIALDAVDELVACGFLVERDAGTMAFTHALIREAVYEALSKTKRAELHRRIANACRSMAGTREEVGSYLLDAALHSSAAVPAVPADVAIDDVHRATDWAISHHAYGQAVIVLTRALKIAPPAERADLTIRRAIAYTRLTHTFVDPAPSPEISSRPGGEPLPA
jgi:DNA-binding SARP family transcriptional activator